MAQRKYARPMKCPDCGVRKPTNGCCPPCRASRELVRQILRDDMNEATQPPQAEEIHAREQKHRQRVRGINTLYYQRRSR